MFIVNFLVSDAWFLDGNLKSKNMHVADVRMSIYIVFVRSYTARERFARKSIFDIDGMPNGVIPILGW